MFGIGNIQGQFQKKSFHNESLKKDKSSWNLECLSSRMEIDHYITKLLLNKRFAFGSFRKISLELSNITNEFTKYLNVLSELLPSIILLILLDGRVHVKPFSKVGTQ